MIGMKRLKKVFAAMAMALACVAPGLAVRASAPSGRYTAGTGTVMDTKTKLTWQQPAGPSAMTWSAAKSYCAGLSGTLGGAGWRLPTMKELATLVDTSASSGLVLDPIAFPTSPSISGYWSATPVAGASPFVWVFGADGTEGQVQSSASSWARCVRSGS